MRPTVSNRRDTHMARKKKNAQTETEVLVQNVAEAMPVETLTMEDVAHLFSTEEIEALDVQLSSEETDVAQDVAETVAEEDVPPATVEDDVDFEQIMVSIAQEDSQRVMDEMSAQIDERKKMEMAKDSYNDNIHRTLAKVRNTMVRHFAARVLIATQVSPSFITEQSREGEHYNVYAMGKLNDLVDGLCGLPLKNAINIAIVRSMFKLREKGIALTRKTLECAASDKIRVTDKEIASALIRHTVGATTAPTQTSSTMRALETLGIVKSTGSKTNTVFELLDTPQTRALESIALQMAA